jgi:hypothetical protein
MNKTEMNGRNAEVSPRFQARITGVFYLVTIVTGLVILFAHGRLGLAFDVITSVCYVAMAAVFYTLSR